MGDLLDEFHLRVKAERELKKTEKQLKKAVKDRNSAELMWSNVDTKLFKLKGELREEQKLRASALDDMNDLFKENMVLKKDNRKLRANEEHCRRVAEKVLKKVVKLQKLVDDHIDLAALCPKCKSKLIEVVTQDGFTALVCPKSELAKLALKNGRIRKV
jgi:chromosome segregation ATPase